MTHPSQPQEPPEEAPQDAIDNFMAQFPGKTEADAKAAWTAARQHWVIAARQHLTDTEKRL